MGRRFDESQQAYDERVGPDAARRSEAEAARRQEERDRAAEAKKEREDRERLEKELGDLAAKDVDALKKGHRW